jgi:hypothetical protein
MMMLSTSTIGFTAPHALTVMHSRPVSCKMRLHQYT